MAQGNRSASVDRVLYLGILLVGLALRLAHLGGPPMDDAEAAQALVAWQRSRGLAYPPAGYSPLVASIQTLLFFLAGGGDWLARFPQAIAGTLLILVPLLLRDKLGRYGTLGAAGLLALSPTLVYVSRRADGGVIWLVLGLCVAWGAWVRYVQERRAHWAVLVGVGLAVGLTADFRVWGALLLGLIVALGGWISTRTLPVLPSSDRCRLVGAFGFVSLLGATLALLYPDGIGATFDQIEMWANHLAEIGPMPWYVPLLSLPLYEPLTLLLALIGLVLLGRAELPVWRALAPFLWAAFGALGLAIVSGGRDAGDVALIVAPLCFLAGVGMEFIVRKSIATMDAIRDTVVFPIAVLIFLAFAMVNLSMVPHSSEPQVSMALFLIGVALILLLLLLYMQFIGRAAYVLLTLSLGVAMLVSTFSASTRLNAPLRNPKEPLVTSTTTQGVRDAIRTIERIGWQYHAYHGKGATIAVEEGLGPVWLWYLRQWDAPVRTIDRLSPSIDAAIVLSAVPQTVWVSNRSYIGQDFVVRATWTPAEIPINQRLRWWLYRQTSIPPTHVDRIVLWTTPLLASE